MSLPPSSAPTATGWSDSCRAGFAPAEGRRLRTAHGKGKVSREQRYSITSLDDMELFHQAVRSHWGIENGLHWRLDMTFREDESRIRRGNAPHNFGVIRHVAMNLLKSEDSKISIRKKRIRAGFNDDYRSKVLMGQ